MIALSEVSSGIDGTSKLPLRIVQVVGHVVVRVAGGGQTAFLHIDLEIVAAVSGALTGQQPKRGPRSAATGILRGDLQVTAGELEVAIARYSATGVGKILSVDGCALFLVRQRQSVIDGDVAAKVVVRVVRGPHAASAAAIAVPSGALGGIAGDVGVPVLVESGAREIVVEHQITRGVARR